MGQTNPQLSERDILTSECVSETVKYLKEKSHRIGTTLYLGNAVEVSVMKVTQSWVCGEDIVSVVTRDGII